MILPDLATGRCHSLTSLNPSIVLLKRAINKMALVGAVIAALAGPSYAEVVSPRRILEVSDLGNPVVSHDGRSVAFRLERASIERNTYDTIWYVQGLDGISSQLRVADGGIPLREYATGQIGNAHSELQYIMS